MLLAKSLAGLAAVSLAAYALPLPQPADQQEYDLLLRGRMGTTTSPVNSLAAVPYAPEVGAADRARTLGQ
ncbi:hypothetical protein LMH87_005202 [Akanthomyces muscarius]|uniref:DUF4148 domain-containing protein n=1 Tax=Akanthomyces muscarius TaxID=2231603 RepID=A0A9W8URR0_AKAMU|nr:hypothetical protein LMH87_005202 [Akanthomyces muscarius]KAJ4163478.1 hypothetical protein LMH87_005202 [Akanthomyces muscarius]